MWLLHRPRVFLPCNVGALRQSVPSAPWLFSGASVLARLDPPTTIAHTQHASSALSTPSPHPQSCSTCLPPILDPSAVSAACSRPHRPKHISAQTRDSAQLDAPGACKGAYGVERQRQRKFGSGRGGLCANSGIRLTRPGEFALAPPLFCPNIP